MTRLLWRSLFVAFAVFTLVVALSSPGKAQTLSDGLAVHYPFDGNPNDVSGNGNDGMLNGDPTFSAGVDGQAIRLDGNGDYTISGSSSTLEINNTLTVSAWIYPRTGSLTSPETNTAKTIAVQGDINDTGRNWQFKIFNTKLQLSKNNTPDVDAASDVSIQENTWTHVAVTFDSGTTRLYINGTLDSEKELGEPSFSTVNDPIRVGDRDLDDDGTDDFNGKIDAFRYYTRTLSASEVQQLYEQAVPPPATLYVNGDADGSGSGTSWANAYTDLQTALDNAGSSSEIWIAEGVYKPDNEGDYFTITGTIDGVELYGGFESGDEFDDRAPKEHRTILSGDLGEKDSDPDNDGIIEDADPDQDGTAENLKGDNAHHVLVLDGGNRIGSNISPDITRATVIDGLYITGGQADGASPRGGGLYCDGQGTGQECSPRVSNVVFSGNAANQRGAALLNAGKDGGVASPYVTGATLVGNTVGGNGGAVLNDGRFGGTANPMMVNVIFVDNSTATSGAAVYNDGDNGDASPTLINTTVTGNVAAVDGGAMVNEGSSSGGTADPQVTNTILWGNSAGSSGDEIHNYEASPTLKHTIIQGGLSGISNASGSSVNGSDNFDTDPRFEYLPLPAGDDGVFGTNDDGLHVTSGSPAVGAGDNTPFQSGNVAENVSTDITGAPRRDGTVEIGAYEGARDQERTIYVDESAAGGTGTSWDDAFTFLQNALAVAGGDDEIWLAEGTYLPDNGERVSDGDETERFTITGNINGIELYGGFESGDAFDDRAPTDHRTILSGDVSNPDTDSDGDNIVEDASNIQGNNSNHVLYLDGTTNGGITRATRIDGVVVTAGAGVSGGGLYCQADGSSATCSPTLARMVFSGNLATDDGGALFNNALNGGISSPKIIGSLFVGNKAADDGGAVLNEDGADPMIANVVFARNRANDESNTNTGGAIYNSGGSPTITNVTFSNNQADAGGGALYIAGSSTPTVTNSILWGNGSSEVGDVDPEDSDKVTFSHSIVEGSGGSGVSWDTGVGVDAGGNLDQDPRFNGGSSLAGDSGQLATTDDSLSLSPGSPGLDAGTNTALNTTGDDARDLTTDFATGPRVQDLDADGTPTVNIGAYESIVPTAPTALKGPVLSVTGATFAGTVNPGGTSATVRFRVYPAGTPDQDTLFTARTLTGAVRKPVRATARRLSPDTRYTVEVLADNENGSASGSPVTFRTPPAPALTVDGGDPTVPVTFTAASADLPLIQDSLVYARKGGGASFTELALREQEGFGEGTEGELRMEASVPERLVTKTGVDYYALVSSGRDGTSTVPTGGATAAARAPLNLSVAFQTLSPDKEVARDLFQAKTYRMASVPAAVNPKTDLTEAYGAYKPQKWRVLQWDAAEETYREFPDLDSTDLTAGNAFWLITEKGDPLSLGTGQTVDASTPRAVELEPGWNQVGTPFLYPVPWDTVRTGSGFAASELDGPYQRGPDGYQKDAVLQPWRGYFVLNATGETDTLQIPPVNADNQTAQSQRLVKAKGGARYTLRATARTTAGVSTATMGLRPAAKVGRDRFDVAKPPPVRPTPQVSVVQQTENRSMPHAKSVKPTDGKGQAWTLRLRRPAQDESPASVRLDWSADGTLPEGQQRYVLDLANEQRVTSGQSFSLEQGETRLLKVIVGTERYAQKNNEGIPLRNYKTELRSNYPNPFEKTTTLEYTLAEERSVRIEIYNVLGQRVRTLVEERKSAGLHRVQWEGRNEYGTRVGSGVYFYRIEAGDFTNSKKMVIVR